MRLIGDDIGSKVKVMVSSHTLINPVLIGGTGRDSKPTSFIYSDKKGHSVLNSWQAAKQKETEEIAKDYLTEMRIGVCRVK